MATPSGPAGTAGKAGTGGGAGAADAATDATTSTSRSAQASQPRKEQPVSGMAVPSVVCLAVLAGLLFVVLPRGFAVGGVLLGPLPELVLLALAVAAGAWGAFSAQPRRVLLGSMLAAAFLSPAYDPRAPLERMPLYVVAGVLFVLHVEFALLHAKVARLSKLPRAHVTNLGAARDADKATQRAGEVELASTAKRIAESWPTPLLLAAGLVGGSLALQALLATIAPRALGNSLELRGPLGLVLAALPIFGGLGILALRKRQRAPQDVRGTAEQAASSEAPSEAASDAAPR